HRAGAARAAHPHATRGHRQRRPAQLCRRRRAQAQAGARSAVVAARPARREARRHARVRARRLRARVRARARAAAPDSRGREGRVRHARGVARRGARRCRPPRWSLCMTAFDFWPFNMGPTEGWAFIYLLLAMTVMWLTTQLAKRIGVYFDRRQATAAEERDLRVPPHGEG